MLETNLHYCATAASIDLYWEKVAAAEMYTVLLDGKVIGQANHTHFTLEHLQPDTEYSAEVRRDGVSIGCAAIRTEKIRHRLNVRTFGAVGDGITMDTMALQAAINACGPQEEVYLPAGVYRTGALRLHSHMALYLDAGAILQGTDCP